MRSLEEILEILESKGVTAYEIAKHTNLTEVGINKIFNRETKKPHKSTIQTLDDYINNYVSLNKSLVEETSISYNRPIKEVVVEIVARQDEALKDMLFREFMDKLLYKRLNELNEMEPKSESK